MGIALIFLCCFDDTLNYSTNSVHIYSSQQAQQGMEKAVKQLASASDEQSKAEAQVAVDFHEALIQSAKA